MDTLHIPEAIRESAPPVVVREADTWVVTYGRYCTIRRETVWSAEAFLDLNEAVDFYGDIESGERCIGCDPGSITAYKDGNPIGALPLRKVAAMVREGRQP